MIKVTKCIIKLFEKQCGVQLATATDHSQQHGDGEVYSKCLFKLAFMSSAAVQHRHRVLPIHA
jgi:hypothetical protein